MSQKKIIHSNSFLSMNSKRSAQLNANDFQRNIIKTWKRQHRQRQQKIANIPAFACITIIIGQATCDPAA